MAKSTATATKQPAVSGNASTGQYHVNPVLGGLVNTPIEQDNKVQQQIKPFASTCNIDAPSAELSGNSAPTQHGTNNCMNIGALSTPQQIDEALALLNRQSAAMLLQAQIIAKLLGMQTATEDGTASE